VADRAAVAGIDIDGVLSDPGHRLHFITRWPRNWRAFFRAAHRDPPLAEGIARVQRRHDDGVTVIYVSGRPEFLRDATQHWLQRHGLPDGPLYLRPSGDRRPAKVLKREVYRRIATEFDFMVILDDDTEVVDMLSAAGLPAQLTDWFDPGNAQPAFEDAQESEGRT
jgi:hypothetical protein